MATCDVQTLLDEGKCFSAACLTPQQQEIVALQLLCNIANKPAGGGGATTLIEGSGNLVVQFSDLTAYPAANLGDFLGAYGWDASTEAAIAAAIAAGKSVRLCTNFFLQVGAWTDPASPNNLTALLFPFTAVGTTAKGGEIDLYMSTGAGVNGGRQQYFLDITTSPNYATNGQIIARMISCPIPSAGSDPNITPEPRVYDNGGTFTSSGKLFCNVSGSAYNSGFFLFLNMMVQILP